MADRPDLHVDDVGVPLVFLVRDRGNKKQPLPLQNALTLELKFTKPSGISVTKDANLYTDGSDGKMMYTTEVGFLDEDGTWKMQGKITDDDSTLNTDIEEFEVGENITVQGS